MRTLGTERSRLAAIVALGLLLFLPALQTPRFLDDYLHRAMLAGTFPGRHGPFDLYDFVTDENRAEMFARGLLPWWTDPALRIRFLRPLASALVWFDHRAFGDHVLVMHLHSAAWWIVAVLGAHALYRTLLGGRRVLLATAMFALAPCHALPLAWLANRESLLALAFGIWSLVAQARARSRPHGLGLHLLATLGFAFAFAFAGEYALGIGGYVLAFALLARDRPLRERLIPVVAFAVPALVYLALRARLGYGTAGSGFYTDPVGDPVGFLLRAPWRITALLAESWLTWDIAAATGGVRGWVALAVGGVIVLAANPLRRALAGEQRTALSVLLLGSLFAMIPMLAVVPSMRLLGTASLGVAPVVATLVERAWFLDRDAPRDRAVQVTWLAALLLGFAQLVHGPGMAWLLSRKYRNDARAFEHATGELADAIGDLDRANVGVVRGLAGTFFAPFALDPTGKTPAHWCVASNAGHVLALRKEERSLDLVASKDHAVVPYGDLNLFRGDVGALRSGETRSTDCFDVTILESSDRGPRIVRLAFKGPPITWVEEKGDTWRKVDLPAVGFGRPFDP